MNNARKNKHKFEDDSAWFLRELSSRKRVLPTFTHASRAITDRTDKELERLVENHGKDKTYDENGKLESYVIAEGYSRRHAILRRAFDDFALFSIGLPNMALVSVVSLFDAFLSRILRNVYLVKPEILNSSTRQLSFADLASFGSIENARDHIIDKEIETLLRDSHIAQFEWLSKRLDVQLTKLPSWKDFVELTERRNLLVHADGKASQNYIDTCNKHDIDLDPSIEVGTKLYVTQDYYINACDCVAEIGLKLVQVLWRKLIPSELKEAEEAFIETCYDLLIQHDYKLAEQVLNLSTANSFKKVNAESGYYIKINLAIALKGQNKTKELDDLLSGIDFSALSSKFKLAELVLKDDFEQAGILMKKIGGSEEIDESNYIDWPLFRWFRKTDHFKSAYLEIYKKEFVIVEDASSLDFDELEEDGEESEGETAIANHSDELDSSRPEGLAPETATAVKTGALTAQAIEA